MARSEESLQESLKLLDDFGKMSGLKLNCGKTEALWIGSKTNCNLRLCPEKNFKWLFKKVKARNNCFSKLQRKIGENASDLGVLEIPQT